MPEFLHSTWRNSMSHHDGPYVVSDVLSGESLYSDLEEEFIDWFESVSSDNFDEELLDAFLTEMEELKP